MTEAFSGGSCRFAPNSDPRGHDDARYRTAMEHAEHAVHAAHDPFDRRVSMTIAIVAAALACITMLSHRAHNATFCTRPRPIACSPRPIASSVKRIATRWPRTSSTPRRPTSGTFSRRRTFAITSIARNSKCSRSWPRTR